MESSMDTQNNGNDIEGLDIDFSFKPITKGLGFHHSKEKQNSIPSTSELQQRASALAESIETARANKAASESSNLFERGELAAFYQKSEPVQEQIKEEIPQDFEVEFTQASMIRRLGAWFTDLFMVAFLFLFTTSIIFLSTFNNFEEVISFLIADNLYINFIPVFLFYYVFYFSFLEKTQSSTIGKSILGIKVVDESERTLALYQTFFSLYYMSI
jgi:hypothetical protein